MNIYTSSHRKAMRTVVVKRYNPNVPLVPMSLSAFCSFSSRRNRDVSIFHSLLISLAGPLSIVRIPQFMILPRGNFYDNSASATILTIRPLFSSFTLSSLI